MAPSPQVNVRVKQPKSTRTKPECRFSQLTDVSKVAVIGGGIASVCVIDELFRQRPELTIDLFCKDDELAQGASGNRQGAIYPLMQGAKSAISLVHHAAFQRAVPFYQSASQRIADHVCNHSNGAIGTDSPSKFQQTGVLQQAMTAELQQRYQAIAEHWPQTISYISAIESSKLAGLNLPFESLWIKDGGWLAPYSFCQQLSQYLQAQYRLNVKLNTPVQSLQPVKAVNGQNQWQLQVSPSADSALNTQKQTTYDAVVICAGINSPSLLETEHDLNLLMPIEPIRGQVSQLTPTTPLAALNTVLCHKGYVTPTTQNYQCFGATFGRNQTDVSVRLADTEQNLNQLQKVYDREEWAQSLKIADVIADRAGIRANSADHLPIAGELFPNQWVLNNVDKNNGNYKRVDKLQFTGPAADDQYQLNPYQGLYTITGLGARGLTTAPLMANIVADMICGKKPNLEAPVLAAISPMRFQIRYLKRNKDSVDPTW